MPVWVSGSQRLPSTKGGPSRRELESLREEPGRTYTCVPRRSRVVAGEAAPQSRVVQDDRQGLALSPPM